MRNYNRFKSILCFVLGFVLSTRLCGALFSSDSLAENRLQAIDCLQQIPESFFYKIHFYVGEIEDNNYKTIDSENELLDAIGCAQSFANADNGKKISLIIQFFSDVCETEEYNNFSQEKFSLSSLDELHSFRKRLNSFSKAFHKELVKNYMADLQLPVHSKLYHIEYSPFVVLELSSENLCSDNIIQLAQKPFIVAISFDCLSSSMIDESSEFEETLDYNRSPTYASWNDVLDAVGASVIVNQGTYCGDGVNIGIYETSATNISIPNHLSNLDLTFIGNTNGLTNHGMYVLSVAASIAPAASYFFQERPSDIVEGLETFLDYDCSIINCSFSINISGNHSYYYLDAVFDYQAYIHYVILTVATGNAPTQGNNYVSSPALAHNVISVGGVSYNSTNTYWYYEDNTACYLTNNGDNDFYKPDICAPFWVSVPNVGNAGGTSLSTPIVTGCLALLVEHDPIFGCSPDTVKSLICTTATRTHDFQESYGALDEKVGAGIVNLQKMINCSDNSCSVYSYNNLVQSGTIYTKQIVLTDYSTVNVSLAWLSKAAEVYGMATLIDTNNYGIMLVTPANVVCGICALTKSNIQAFRTTTLPAGNYSIKVFHINTSSSTDGVDYLELTWQTDVCT